MIRSLAFLSLIFAFHVHGTRTQTASMRVTENLIDDGVESTELVLKSDDSDTITKIILKVEEDETTFAIDSCDIERPKCGCLKIHGLSAGIPYEEGQLSLSFVDRSQCLHESDPTKPLRAALFITGDHFEALVLKMEGIKVFDSNEEPDFEIVETIPWDDSDKQPNCLEEVD